MAWRTGGPARPWPPPDRAASDTPHTGPRPSAQALTRSGLAKLPQFASRSARTAMVGVVLSDAVLSVQQATCCFNTAVSSGRDLSSQQLSAAKLPGCAHPVRSVRSTIRALGFTVWVGFGFRIRVHLNHREPPSLDGCVVDNYQLCIMSEKPIENLSCIENPFKSLMCPPCGHRGGSSVAASLCRRSAGCSRWRPPATDPSPPPTPCPGLRRRPGDRPVCCRPCPRSLRRRRRRHAVRLSRAGAAGAALGLLSQHAGATFRRMLVRQFSNQLCHKGCL